MPIKYTDEPEQKQPAKEPSFLEAMKPEKEFLTGMVRGALGGPGELERFGAYTVPQFVGGLMGRRDFGQEPKEGRATLFPTTEEVGKGMEALGIEQKPGGVGTAGEIIGGLGTAIPGLVRGGKALAQRLAETKPVRMLRGKETAAAQERLGREAAGVGATAQRAIEAQSAAETARLARSAETRAAAERAGQREARKGESALRELAGVRTIPEAGAFRPVPQTADEVGQFIRRQSENFVTGIKNRRSELSARNFAETLDEAKQLESVGQFVQNTEKFADLVKFIDGRLQVVTDPTIRSQLETIRTALTKGAPTKLSEGERRVIALREGKALDQVPEQTFLQPTFEGVEIMRRRIGDAAFGVPEEGYKAIGQGMAKDIYTKLSDAMKDYSKGFTKYLDDYKRLSQPIEVYGTKIGKGITETVDAGGRYYAKTAEQVAKDIFSNPERVKEFVDAVGGNKQIVDAAARRYFAGLAEKAKTPQAVEKLLADNRAVLKEFPGVADEITSRYLAPLRQTVTRGEAAESIIKGTQELDKQIAAQLKNVEGSKTIVSDAVKALTNAKPGKTVETFEGTVLPKIRDAESRAGTRLFSDQQIEALRRQVAEVDRIADRTQKARIIAGILGTYFVGQTAASGAGKIGSM